MCKPSNLQGFPLSFELNFNFCLPICNFALFIYLFNFFYLSNFLVDLVVTKLNH